MKQLVQVTKKVSKINKDEYIIFPKKFEKTYITNEQSKLFDDFLKLNGYFDVDILVLYYKNKTIVILDLIILNETLPLLSYSDRLSILQSKLETDNVKIITHTTFSDLNIPTFYRPLSDTGLTLTKIILLNFKIRCIVGEFTDRKRYFLLADDYIGGEFVISCVATYQHSFNIIKGHVPLKVCIPNNIKNYTIYSQEIYVKCIHGANTILGLPIVTNLNITKSKRLDPVILNKKSFKPKPNNKTLLFLKRLPSDLLICELVRRKITNLNINRPKILEYETMINALN